MTSDNVGSSADVSPLHELLATGKPVKIRKAIGELDLISDDGTALALAARFERAAEFSSEALLGGRNWRPRVIGSRVFLDC
ncbi:hypothetical protein [Streptomyces sp. NPDC048527]|uniref:hypothetical protein n=1 Tax=Streptomyces sp. NPDC048527 TaxID=3365568 RepID=UPI00371C7FD8